MKVAVFGLGSMGYGMAQSLLRAGHRVAGYDVNETAVAKFRDEGGLAEDKAAAAPSLDAVVIVVLNAEQTESVLFGPDGVAPSLKPGAVVISCATVSPAFARDMEARCGALGLLYLDSPISGGAVKAAQGQLSVMAAGTKDAFAAAAPLLDAMAENVFELGDAAGPGSAMKSINQLLAGVHIAAMGEAITFGLTQGVPVAKTVEVIAQCAGTSWMFENRGPHVADADYTPRSAVKIWLKDLGIVQAIAETASLGTPMADAALVQFKAAAAMGLTDEDDAAVTKVYARDAGVALPGD